MSAVDIALLALGGFFIARGLMRGLTGEFFSLLGVIGGFYCSMTYCAPLSGAISAKWEINPLITTTIAIVVIFLTVFLFCAVAGKQIKKLLRATHLSRLDTILGGAAGLFKTTLVILAVLVVAIVVSPITGNGWVRKSKILMGTAQALPLIYPPLEERGLVPNIEELRMEAAEFLLNRSLSALTESAASDDILPGRSDDLRRKMERTADGERRRQIEKLAQRLGLGGNESADQTIGGRAPHPGPLEYFFGPDGNTKTEDKSDDK